MCENQSTVGAYEDCMSSIDQLTSQAAQSASFVSENSNIQLVIWVHIQHGHHRVNFSCENKTGPTIINQ